VTSRWAYFCLMASLAPASVAGQTADPPGDRLSLNAAIRMAVENNRLLETAKLKVQKAEDDLAAARTRRLPALETTMLASQLLTPVDFSFPRGAFGDFPGIGPIPATDTDITTQRRPNVFLSSQVTQPLSKLVRINLNIQGAAATRDIEREHARDQELSIVNAVKRQYFAILQTQSALAASEDAIALYRELNRTLEVRVAQKVALRSDALDVEVRLAQEELTRMTRANTLASQKEQLNQTLGRDVRTAFDIDGVPAISALDVDLRAAQARALDGRPDVREARLKVQQADLDRRLKKAERIPDVALAVSYLSNFNLDVLPKNMATVGVQVTWEPFDWGRKGREVAAKSRVLEQTRLGVRETEDRAVLEINSLFRKLAENRAFLNVTQLAQGAAREKLRVKTNQFQIQSALLSDVLHQRAELADTNDRYQQALLAFWTAKADFERAVGEEVIP
jgi:outer membrane protein TolC